MKRAVFLLLVVAVTTTNAVALGHLGGMFPSFGLSPFPQMAYPECVEDIAGLFDGPCDEPGHAIGRIWEAFQ